MCRRRVGGCARQPASSCLELDLTQWSPPAVLPGGLALRPTDLGVKTASGSGRTVTGRQSALGVAQRRHHKSRQSLPIIQRLSAHMRWLLRGREKRRRSAGRLRASRFSLTWPAVSRSSTSYQHPACTVRALQHLLFSSCCLASSWKCSGCPCRTTQGCQARPERTPPSGQSR